MTITYQQFADGKTNIKQGEGLVLGWMVRDHVSEREYLYALDQAGRALRCDVPIFTTNFDTRQRTWWPVAAIPPAAEFIGNYPQPRRIAQDTVPSSKYVASAFSYDRD